ncbi:MAG: hypothetical protein AAGN46_08750 [Acidobacteriota bacterium]
MTVSDDRPRSEPLRGDDRRLERPAAQGSRAVQLALVVSMALGILAMSLARTLTGSWEPVATFLADGAHAASEVSDPAAANRSMLAAMRRFEDALDDTSPLRAAILPTVQWASVALGGVGNATTVVGDDDWLLLRPGVDHLLGRGFLDAGELMRRTRGGEAFEPAPHPDPRPAILDTARQLAQRDIELWVLFAPTKAAIHPEALGAAIDEVAANPSTARLAEELQRAGVVVVDPSPMLRTMARAGEQLFLRTDSHWSPRAVDAVARVAAAAIEERVRLSPGDGPLWRRRARVEVGRGDLFAALRLPERRPMLPREEVEILQVLDGRDRFWAPDPSAEVLLLGDSFTNVFAESRLGWGEAAGLAEQMSFHLGRPLDRLAVDDGSATEVRRRLAALERDGAGRLDRKRVIVWQIAVRELSFGDWRTVDLGG